MSSDVVYFDDGCVKFPRVQFTDMYFPIFDRVKGKYIQGVYESAMRVVLVAPKNARFKTKDLCIFCPVPRSAKQNPLRGLVISMLVDRKLLPIAKLYKESNHIVYCKTELAKALMATRNVAQKVPMPADTLNEEEKDK